MAQTAVEHKRLCAEILGAAMRRTRSNYDFRRQIDFSLMAAAYSHFYPGANHREILTLFNAVLAYQALTAAEAEPSFANYLLDKAQVLDAAEILAKPDGKKPRIFCTFHYGSYRLISYFLGAREFDVCLAVTSDIIAKQGERYHQQHTASGYSCRFRLLDAEDPRIIRNAMRALKDGYSLLFYIDGNSGVGGMNRQDSALRPIPFLGRALKARLGIAFLSALAGVPIVPIMTYRTNLDRYEIRIEPPMAIPKRQESDLAEAIASLYSVIEPWISAHPEQWEAWLYLYKWIPATDPAKARESEADEPHTMCARPLSLHFNAQGYELVDYRRAKTLLNKRTMRMSILDDRDFRLLSRVSRFLLSSRLDSDDLRRLRPYIRSGVVRTNVIP